MTRLVLGVLFLIQLSGAWAKPPAIPPQPGDDPSTWPALQFPERPELKPEAPKKKRRSRKDQQSASLTINSNFFSFLSQFFRDFSQDQDRYYSSPKDWRLQFEQRFRDHYIEAFYLQKTVAEFPYFYDRTLTGVGNRWNLMGEKLQFTFFPIGVQYWKAHDTESKLWVASDWDLRPGIALGGERKIAKDNVLYYRFDYWPKASDLDSGNSAITFAQVYTEFDILDKKKKRIRLRRITVIPKVTFWNDEQLQHPEILFFINLAVTPDDGQK